MQFSSTEDNEYINKSHLFYNLFKMLYVDNLKQADEGCLIFSFVDVLQIVKKKRETYAGRVIINISNNRN